MVTHSSILAWRIPMDRGAWWAAVHGVTKSWTWLSTSTTTDRIPSLPAGATSISPFAGGEPILEKVADAPGMCGNSLRFLLSHAAVAVAAKPLQSCYEPKKTRSLPYREKRYSDCLSGHVCDKNGSHCATINLRS